jgi:hypothetical protein
MADDTCYPSLTRDQWAWEFMRRNPDYQTEYRQFIALWRALEADYGTPPNRDFARWKHDPRAYGPLPGGGVLDSPSGELCLGENEQVLIECWMGAKWGFYKFPLDPTSTRPPLPDELAWRPPPPSNVPPDTTYQMDISFDLSLPLPPQLEAAKFRLVSRATELRRNGLAAPKTVSNQRERWMKMLRLLDNWSEAISMDEAEKGLLHEAQAMVQGGYVEILRLNAAE